MTARSAKLRVPVGSLGALSELGAGGQGTVYALTTEAATKLGLPYTDLVYKEYDRSARATLDPEVLDEMARFGGHLTPGQEGLGTRVAWPLATVERDGAVSGFLMRRAPEQFMVDLTLPSGPKRTLAEAQHLLNEERFLIDRQLLVHDRWRLQFLRDTADTLAQLHRNGITVGDLSPKNLLASFTSRPCCFFLDCDTMRMNNDSALPQVETTGWEIPKNEERATSSSDAYKLALLAIRLFAGDQDSKDITALSSVSRPLGALARSGISADPSVRPTPAEWLPALDAAMPVATPTLPGEGISARGPGGVPTGGPPAPGAAPFEPPSVQPPAPSNWKRALPITLACLVGLLILIGVLEQAMNSGSIGNTAAPTAPIFYPTSTDAPPDLSDPATAYEELNRQVQADDAEVRGSVAEHWVPQLASARKGLPVNGIIFDYPDILAEHRALRQSYPQARLVYSADWPVFQGQDFFVTILAIPHATAEDANNWCDQQGIDGDHCYAKLLSQSSGFEGTTRHR